MFYSLELTVTHGTTEATADQVALEVSAGVIHQADLIFPSASSKEVYAQVFVGNYQFLPCNHGGAIRGDDMVISTREFYEMTRATNLVILQAWNVHASDDLLLILNIGVLPKKVLQPFSFEELLKAAAGL